MLTKRPWLTLSLFSLFFLVLGILIETCVQDWPIIKIKPEVDVFAAISAVASAAVTLIVAYWVTTVLEKRISDNRTEKDIILKHIEVIFVIVEQVRAKVQSGSSGYTVAGSSIKRINLNTTAIITSGKDTSIKLVGSPEKSIINQSNYIKDLLTGSNDPEISVTNGIVFISSNRQTLIDVELDKLRINVLQMELEINKS